MTEIDPYKYNEYKYNDKKKKEKIPIRAYALIGRIEYKGLSEDKETSEKKGLDGLTRKGLGISSVELRFKRTLPKLK